jgi:uncharacterized BrkB/YihY/UPF0761 family membrane protein
MIKNFRIIKIFIFSFLIFGLSSNMVLASNNPIISSSTGIENQTEAFKVGAGFSSTGDEKTLVDIVSSVITTILSILGLVFLILIIISGYQWMTAGGNEDAIAKAKKRITNAVIGLIIVLLSYGITWFIFYYLPFAGSDGGAIMNGG